MRQNTKVKSSLNPGDINVNPMNQEREGDLGGGNKKLPIYEKKRSFTSSSSSSKRDFLILSLKVLERSRLDLS